MILILCSSVILQLNSYRQKHLNKYCTITFFNKQFIRFTYGSVKENTIALLCQNSCLTEDTYYAMLWKHWLLMVIHITQSVKSVPFLFSHTSYIYIYLTKPLHIKILKSQQSVSPNNGSSGDYLKQNKSNNK